MLACVREMKMGELMHVIYPKCVLHIKIDCHKCESERQRQCNKECGTNWCMRVNEPK
jgi:hypothetical protein